MLQLSNKEARHLMLTNQGLADNFFGNKKEGTLKAIEHLGYVQIDTISVVERAHHHTIWSRVNDYKKSYLDQLIEKDKTVFEYWSHAAAYLPMRDYRFSLYRKNLIATGKLKWYFNKKVTGFVYDRIVAEGPLQSKDFEEEKKNPGWWEWKESKRALEQLFMEGKLMIAKRQGFQKVYDLTERVLPKKVNTRLPTEKEYAEYLVTKTIRANGLAAKNEIGYLRSHAKPAVSKMLSEMQEAGLIIPMQITGMGNEIFYTSQQSLDRAEHTKATKAVRILSPFDNCVIQRARLKNLFDYDYTIECYVPEPKRKYGYFCLPVLYGDTFVGRIDCKAERTEQILYVKAMFYEKKPTAVLKAEVKKGLQNFAAFNGCMEVKGLK